MELCPEINPPEAVISDSCQFTCSKKVKKSESFTTERETEEFAVQNLKIGSENSWNRFDVPEKMSEIFYNL